MAFTPGQWVQERRKYLKLTRVELAKRAACSAETIKKIENGKRRPSKAVADGLADHLQIADESRERFFRFVRGEPGVEMPAPDDLTGALPLFSGGPQKIERPDRFAILSRLTPLPDQRLFGIEEKLSRLEPELDSVYRPWLIAIDGIGGIGKTTLAHTLVHRFLNNKRFDDIGWVSAKQEEYVTGRGIRPVKGHVAAIDEDALVDTLLVQLADGPYPIDNKQAKRVALKELLQRKVCLVVVDNLETVADYEALLPLLRHLAKPSKFLITTRMSLQNEHDIHAVSMTELSRDDTLALLRHEAAEQQSLPLEAADTPLLDEIYRTVGGNPLALKLVVGQTHYLPIDEILSTIRLSQTRDADQLYHYIYRQAWEMLDEPARKLLLALPIVPNGTFKQLVAASELPPYELHAALADLRTLSLVEVGADAVEPRYRIHRLTETFLMHEVIRWGEDENQGEEPTPEGSFFQDRVEAMVTHWKGNEALTTADIEQLDREKEGILTAIRLSLSIPSAWAASKALIMALTSYMERRGHWQEWQVILEEGIAVAQSQGDTTGEIELMGVRGRILIRQSKTGEVIRNFRNVIRLARKTGNRLEEARACSNLGFNLINTEQFWRSKQFSCHALDLFEEMENKHGLAHTHNHLGVLYLRIQEWEKSENHLLLATSIWEGLNDLNSLQMGLGNLGYLKNEANDPNFALHYLKRCVQILEKTGDQTGSANIFLNLAISYHKLENLNNALSYIEKAESLFKKQANLTGLCTCWEVKGEIQSRSDKVNNALHYYDSALKGFEKLNHIEGQARVESRKLMHFLRASDLASADQLATKLTLFRQENRSVKNNQYVIQALGAYENFRAESAR